MGPSRALGQGLWAAVSRLQMVQRAPKPRWAGSGKVLGMPSTVRDMSQAQKGLELSGELAAWRGNGTLMGHGAHAHPP